jgi:hypothetical protein
LVPTSSSVNVLETATFTVGFPLGPPVGAIDRVDFSSSNGAVVSICDVADPKPCPAGVAAYSDFGASYQTDATGYVIGGSAILEAEVIMGGALTCSDTSTVNVTNPVGWFQVKGGDMTADGSISSVIQVTCTLPACDPVLITADAGEDPGVPSFLGSINPGLGLPDPPYISSTEWNVKSSYSGPTPDYDFFERKLPSGIPFFIITTSSVAGSVFNLGGTEYRGYYWYKYEGVGDLRIQSPINLPAGRRVVLMVESDLEIGANINHDPVSPGRNFFMVLARGDIRVLDTAGGAPGTGPHLEGIFLADGQFRTETGSNQVHVRGGVVALGGIDLRRDLPDNSQTPAEIFEFGADQLFLFPAPMSQRQISWREVAP